MSDILSAIKDLEERGFISGDLKNELWQRALKEGPNDILIEDLASYRTIGLQNKVVPRAPEKKKSASSAGVICLILLVATGYYFLKDAWTIPQPKPVPEYKARPTPIDEGSDYGAYSMAKRFVSDRLLTPSKAEFPSMDGRFVMRTDPDAWLVTAYVDSQNAYGAMIRKRFWVRLKYVGKDKWRMTDINIW